MDNQKYYMHTVGSGDTIQSIGDMYGVDWTEIVTLNGLEYPYIDDDIIDNEHQFIDSVAKIGSKLLIPNSGLPVPIKSNNSATEIEEYAFGCDLDLFTYNESTYKVVNLETPGELIDDKVGDILTCRGVDNLRQQLILRLGTPKGALLLHPDFGSNILEYTGKRVTQEVLTDVKLEIQECLLGDFRVNAVSDINLVFKDNSIRVECVVYPIAPYSSPFILGHTYSN